MNIYNPNDFVFSSRYRLLRHAIFWTVHTLMVAVIWYRQGRAFEHDVFRGVLWLPVRMLYCYPLMYIFLPRLLLKERYLRFCFVLLAWAIFGWFLNYLFRAYIFIPMQEYVNIPGIERNAWQPSSFLVLTTTAGITGGIYLFKHWVIKQQQWLRAEKEKTTAELQLLKAQVHPHFLFNTLNNIYSFALHKSPKAPDLILKLSSLLSYMLYDCRSDEVFLEKEVEILKNYIDLEKERYGNRIDISLNIEGDIKGKIIAPLLLLPFVENAFKHGTAEQLDKPWLSLDLVVAQNRMHCKIVNSKSETVISNNGGLGIENAKKRLMIFYPGCHEIKITNEDSYFVVSLSLLLKEDLSQVPVVTLSPAQKALT